MNKATIYLQAVLRAMQRLPGLDLPADALPADAEALLAQAEALSMGVTQPPQGGFGKAGGPLLSILGEVKDAGMSQWVPPVPLTCDDDSNFPQAAKPAQPDCSKMARLARGILASGATDAVKAGNLLDVLYTHWQSPDLSLYPLEETVEAMTKLKEQGKIRAIGASNTTAELIRGYCKYGQLDIIQEKYSLLTRRVEKQLLPTCKELGVSIQAYSPLEQGLLTGKVTMDTTYPEGSTRNSNPCFQPARRAQAIRLLEGWKDLTEKYGCTLSQLVIALTARMIPGLHVLCGARTPEQAADNAKALHLKLDGADAVRMKWDVDAIS